MTTRKYAVAALLAFCAGIFVRGLFIRPAEGAIAIRDSAHVDLARLDSSELARQSADSIAFDSVAARQPRIDGARPTAALAGQSADSLRDTLLGKLPTLVRDSIQRDSVRRMVLAMDSVRRVQTTLLAGALLDAMQQANTWRARYEAANAAAIEAHRLLKVATARIDSLVPMTVRPARCGLGVGGGYALTGRGAGPGVTVGVVCRI